MTVWRALSCRTNRHDTMSKLVNVVKNTPIACAFPTTPRQVAPEVHVIALMACYMNKYIEQLKVLRMYALCGLHCDVKTTFLPKTIFRQHKAQSIVYTVIFALICKEVCSYIHSAKRINADKLNMETPTVFSRTIWCICSPSQKFQKRIIPLFPYSSQ